VVTMLETKDKETAIAITKRLKTQTWGGWCASESQKKIVYMYYNE
jgi:hypothetical protein